MSKLYKKYLELKEKDSNKYYLFECGIFYLFLDEDAIKINELFGLKLTHLNDEIYKCGFPIRSIEKYLNYFNENHLDVFLVEKESRAYSVDFCMDIICYIKSIDLNKITPMEALNILSDVKEKL